MPGIRFSGDKQRARHLHQRLSRRNRAIHRHRWRRSSADEHLADQRGESDRRRQAPTAPSAALGTPTLTIANISAADEGQSLTRDHGVRQWIRFSTPISNPGHYVEHPLAQFSWKRSPPRNKRREGLDWNTGASWSDGNPVSLSVYSAPGSTYEIVASGAHWSALPVSTNAIFPGKCNGG